MALIAGDQRIAAQTHCRQQHWPILLRQPGHIRARQRHAQTGFPGMQPAHRRVEFGKRPSVLDLQIAPRFGNDVLVDPARMPRIKQRIDQMPDCAFGSR